MTDSPVIFEKDGRLARITLNRPEVLNAIDERIPRLLQDAVEKANADENLSCLLYTSPSPRDKRQSRMPSSA